MYLNVESSLFLFDTYIGSILSYASEVWGTQRGDYIEKVHLDFCKRILGVKKSTCNVMIYAELGRLPLHAISMIRKFRLIKYWGKLLSTENCILKECYIQLLNSINTNNWLSGIRDILNNLDLMNVWYSQKVDHVMLLQIKHRIFDQEKQLILSKLSDMTKCNLYKHLIDRITLQHYLTKYIPKKYMKCLTMFRLSSHSLSVETGRYHGILNVNRTCNFCKQDIEDEFHFILKCPVYDDLRILYIKPYYRTRTSVFKLILLLSTKNVKDLCKFRRFLFKAYRLRQGLLSS